MAEVVESCAPVLKQAGFRKRRQSFNRRTSAGLVHVVTLWMHPKEPPAWTEVPGLRERGYGTFRLDVGVHVPEMTRSHTPRSSWVNEYDCHLRRTAGQLAGDELGDRWWPLADPEADAWALSALESLALPWLDRFPDHDAIVETFRADGPLPIGMSPAGAARRGGDARGPGAPGRGPDRARAAT